MKTKLIALTVFAILLLQSCYKPGEIQVKNNITKVKISDVKWGDIYIATDLFPGESSKKLTIDRYEEKLPGSHKISFKMTANNKSIYLQTEVEYLLNEDDDLFVTLTDSTKVKNPNE